MLIIQHSRYTLTKYEKTEGRTGYMQWYLGCDGKTTGPLSDEQARLRIMENPKLLVWSPGFADWLPAREFPELTERANITVPPLPCGAGSGTMNFRILGRDMQFVEVLLSPGESIVAEAGALMYKDETITMETVFGDGSARSGRGFMGKLLGAGKRVLTGESLFITQYTQNGDCTGHVAFGASFPGTIVPLSLSTLGGSVVCRRNNLLCVGKGVSIGLYFRKKIPAGFFGRDGFIMHKLEGDGTVFIHAGGTVAKKDLVEGENLDVVEDCIAAFDPEVGFDTKKTGNMKNIFLRRNGIRLVRLRGPGKVWLQSLPLSRLAGRILKAAAQNGGSGKNFKRDRNFPFRE